MSQHMRALSIASEAVPLVKTGGLADVAGALPEALAPHDVALTTMVPGYPAVLAAIAPKGRAKPKVLHTWPDLIGAEARLIAAKLPNGHPLLVLDCPQLFARDGGPYADGAGRDWDDNWRRFAAFGRAAADVAGGGAGLPPFALAHAHDWQGAMALAYLRFAPPAGAPPVARVMTIHNMAFQGWFGAGVFPHLRLPDLAWKFDGVEYHNGVGFLKAGLEAADAITTVSPTYALEIREAEFGMGLEGLVRSRGARVHGIVNGIDPAEWNPATDPALAARYTARTLARRLANKRAIEAEFGLEPGEGPRGGGPIHVVVSRLTWQKGSDVLAEVIDHLVGTGGRLAILGSGDAALEAELRAAAARHPGRVGLRIGYDEALAHRLQGGGDTILVPSRFEPCGLTQLYGLAYGCIPVVATTGGLADTVVDANPAALAANAATGIQVGAAEYRRLARAIDRVHALYTDERTWRQLQASAMRSDFSWKASGASYARLYRALIEEGE